MREASRRAGLATFWLVVAGCHFAGISGEPEDEDPIVDDEADAGDIGAPDGDSDTVPDADDNCVEIPNPSQRDEDGDQVGDACDNCPARANADQANTGELDAQQTADDVGDACDPRPTESGDSIAHFDGFNDQLGASWLFAPGSQSWSVLPNGLSRTDTSGVGTIYYSGASYASVVVDTRVAIDDMGCNGGDNMCGVGVVAHYDDVGEDGYACIEAQNTQTTSNTVAIYDFAPATVQQIGTSATATPRMNDGEIIDIRFASTGVGNRVECERVNNGNTVTRAQNVSRNASGYVGLHTYRTGVTYQFLVIYSLGGPI